MIDITLATVFSSVRSATQEIVWQKFLVSGILNHKISQKEGVKDEVLCLLPFDLP